MVRSSGANFLTTFFDDFKDFLARIGIDNDNLPIGKRIVAPPAQSIFDRFLGKVVVIRVVVKAVVVVVFFSGFLAARPIIFKTTLSPFFLSDNILMLADNAAAAAKANLELERSWWCHAVVRGRLLDV
jgi:hypothetical protein